MNRVRRPGKSPYRDLAKLSALFRKGLLVIKFLFVFDSVFCFFVFCFHTNGGSVDEWLESWTYNPEAPNSSPALADSWIGSR